MDERITTKLKLLPRDRQLLQEVGEKMGGASISVATSFILKKAAKQVLALLEEEINIEAQLVPTRGSGEAQLVPTRGSGEAQLVPTRGSGEAQLVPIRGSGEAQLVPTRGPGDAISDLDALLGS